MAVHWLKEQLTWKPTEKYANLSKPTSVAQLKSGRSDFSSSTSLTRASPLKQPGSKTPPGLAPTEEFWKFLLFR